MSEDSLRAAPVAKNNSSTAIEAPKKAAESSSFAPTGIACISTLGAPPVSTEVPMLDNTD